MVLSMRAVGGGAELRPGASAPSGFEEDMRRGMGGPGAKDKKRGGKKGRGGRDDYDDFDDSGRRGFATGGATIGERLGMLKGFLTRDEDEDEAETGEGAAEADAETAASEETN